MTPLQSLENLLAPAADSTAAQPIQEIVTLANDIKTMSIEELISTVTDWVTAAAGKIILAVVIYIVGRWIIKKLTHLLTTLSTRRAWDPSLSTFLRSLLSISLTILLLLTVISTLGIHTSSFVALIASAGVAIGMALSGTLQNFAGGVMILLLKPYKIGDYIEAQGEAGVVKEIQIFSTVLTTPDNKVIVIPNGGLSTGILRNFSKEPNRRVDWTFGVAYGTDFKKVKAEIETILAADTRILRDPAWYIALAQLGDSSVNLTVRAWVASAEYWNVMHDINERVYTRFTEAGISIPFPQVDVHLVK